MYLSLCWYSQGFIAFLYTFNFTLAIATYKGCSVALLPFLSLCFIAEYICRLCMWWSIDGSTVSLLPWKRSEILLSVSFSKLDSNLLTLSKTTWQSCNIFSSCFSGCNLLSQCCNSYEFCVSCCLNPARVISWVLVFFSFVYLFLSFSIKYLQYGMFFRDLLILFCRHKKNKYWRWRLLSKLPQVKCYFPNQKERLIFYFTLETLSKLPCISISFTRSLSSKFEINK